MLRKPAMLVVFLFLASLAFAQMQEESLVKVLRTTNKAQTNKYVCEALRFCNVNPFHVVNYFWSVTSREDGGIYSFANPEGNGGYLVVICPEYQLPSLRQMAKDLDRADLNSAQGSKLLYYRMKHRSVTDQDFLAVAGNYMAISDVTYPDPETNSLCIWGTPAGTKSIYEVLEKELDVPSLGAQLDVCVYEIALNNDTILGLDYEAWKNGPGQQLFSFGWSGYSSDGEAFGIGSGNTNYYGSYLDYPSEFFDYLVAEGKAKTSIETKAVASHDTNVMLEAMDEIMVYETTNSDAPNRQLDAEIAVDPTTVPPENYEVGIALDLTPQISLEMVNVQMALEVSSLQQYDSKGLPVITENSTFADVSIPDGTSAVVGGLTRTQMVKTTRKMPILGSLPVLGWLFGGENNTTKQSIVVTVVKPTVLGDDSNVTAADKALAADAGM